MESIIVNLKVLIWRKLKVNKNYLGKKENVLSTILRVTPDEAYLILEGNKKIKDSEIKLLANTFEIEETVLRYGSLLEYFNMNILRENVIYFLGALNELGRGKKTELAEYAGVDKVTVSRWSKGEVLPSGENLTLLKKYVQKNFGSSINMDIIPFFLDTNPPGIKYKKEELKKMIDEMMDEEFDNMYIALKKILD